MNSKRKQLFDKKKKNRIVHNYTMAMGKELPLFNYDLTLRNHVRYSSQLSFLSIRVCPSRKCKSLNMIRNFILIIFTYCINKRGFYYCALCSYLFTSSFPCSFLLFLCPLLSRLLKLFFSIFSCTSAGLESLKFLIPVA